MKLHPNYIEALKEQYKDQEYKGSEWEKADKSLFNQSTQSIRDINHLIMSDERVEHSLLTIYDGMTICYVK